jgi:hypothetical protein
VTLVTHFLRKLVSPTAVALAALLALPALGSAQAEPRQTRIRLGGGLILADAVGAFAGTHVLGDLTTYFAPAFGIQADWFASVFRRGQTDVPQTSVTTGGSVGAILVWPRQGVRPYLGAGVGYTRIDYNGPRLYDFGYSITTGLEAEFWGRQFFADLRPRFFGAFGASPRTESITLLTAGWRVR